LKKKNAGELILRCYKLRIGEPQTFAERGEVEEVVT